MNKKLILSLLILITTIPLTQAVEIITYTPPFAMDKQPVSINYQPLKKSQQKWKLCAVYPHLKDSYWLSVNYGMVQHAQKLGIQLKVLEAGGYPYLEKQQSQLKDCKEWGADAIILGTVDSQAYDGHLTELTGSIPVFSTINDLDMLNPDSHKNIVARVGINWYEMGYKTGEFLAAQHPKNSPIVNVALLPGPKQRGGTKPMVQGFLDAIQQGNINVVRTAWADNSKELQRNLLQQLFVSGHDIDYIVGSAVAAEVAISELRTNKMTADVNILSTYLSHGVYRGLLRNKILFSPTDKMAQQAMLSVDQAVRYLEGKPLEKDLSPKIEGLTPNNLPEQAILDSLSSSEFRPVFDVGINK
ncbi:TMAO reductase system periplasmic protein TorT [Photobacterium makurazakiensis]|uniref:TMAO reductase system periplasmic protein TorT n=1 Tax=Photobacterium makurazakiensis TaxID=2910234 RepID=UPI003D10C945